MNDMANMAWGLSGFGIATLIVIVVWRVHCLCQQHKSGLERQELADNAFNDRIAEAFLTIERGKIRRLQEIDVAAGTAIGEERERVAQMVAEAGQRHEGIMRQVSQFLPAFPARSGSAVRTGERGRGASQLEDLT